MSRCDECEKKKISMDRMATILSQQSNDWHKQRERIEELEGALRLLVSVSEDGFIESCDSEDSKQWEARMIKAIKAGRYALSEGGGVCQNCMGEGVDLIQSGRMVIKEICTSCNGTGRSEGGADGTK